MDCSSQVTQQSNRNVWAQLVRISTDSSIHSLMALSQSRYTRSGGTPCRVSHPPSGVTQEEEATAGLASQREAVQPSTPRSMRTFLPQLEQPHQVPLEVTTSMR